MVVEIRSVDSLSEARRCVEIQRAVWGFAHRDLVTDAMLLTCARAGGIVLGAYPPSHRLIGFVFSFPAPLGAVLIQHSHMLAVLPQFRDRGVGHQLKWAQFQQARRQGCTRITWTYDPLEARNAFLNLNKLGARASRYYTNLYGEQTSSQLHQGIGTDRLLAEWSVQASQPTAVGGKVNLDQALGLPQILPVKLDAGRLEPMQPRLGLQEDLLALEIPASIQYLKRVDLALARLWRDRTRDAFRHYLDRGYQACGVLMTSDSDQRLRRIFYCLQPALPAAAEEAAGQDEDPV